MKVLAISDSFIPKEMMEAGLIELAKNGYEIVIREWSHENLERLQEDNLRVEQEGSEAVELPEHLLKDIETFDIIITQFAPIGKAVIERAKKLKYIGVLRGGIENVNLDKAQENKIIVQNTPGRNARSVAEFAVGVILAETRNIARVHEGIRKGFWPKDFPNKDEIPEIGGKVIGIVGFGSIGQYVAQFLSSFDVDILFYDPFVAQHKDYKKVDSLEELLKISDIITLHGRMTEETHHMIKKHQFELMKKSAVFVNTARSGLVDESALIEALKEKQIMGAAIDTFDHEPLEPDSPFLELENVTLTNHLAGSTIDAFKNTPHMQTKKILSFFSDI